MHFPMPISLIDDTMLKTVGIQVSTSNYFEEAEKEVNYLLTKKFKYVSQKTERFDRIFSKLVVI